jgi:hypothetical protein
VRGLHWFGLVLALNTWATGLAAEREEHFDKDPDWHGHNNRAKTPEPREIRQDFGYSTTKNISRTPGEIGGFITPAGEPAYYAKAIPKKTFNDSLSASGKLVCPKGPFHVLLGFFNTSTVNEWRTPNSIAIRLQGRGEVFFTYVEYCTGRWRAGGDSPGGFATIGDPASDRLNLKGFPSGTKMYPWSMSYDPNGNNGNGSVKVTIGDETAICHLSPEHKSDGAAFNHFGLLNVVKSADGAGELWLDDVTVNGETETFDRDPRWDEFQNRRTYMTEIVRPRFNFGYSATHFAGGNAAGEMGGLIFRGDGRYTNTMAFYGARLGELTLDKPLRASGKIALRRGVSDSDVPFGFFHAEHSLNSGASDAIGTPPDFLGFSIGGPSREGFMIAPAYRLHDMERQSASRGPYLLPDGKSHEWTLNYSPPTADRPGSIVVTLDGQSASLSFPVEHQKRGAHFNRFGLISTHTDGNAQLLYFDDLTYTSAQD